MKLILPPRAFASDGLTRREGSVSEQLFKKFREARGANIINVFVALIYAISLIITRGCKCPVAVLAHLTGDKRIYRSLVYEACRAWIIGVQRADRRSLLIWAEVPSELWPPERRKKEQNRSDPCSPVKPDVPWQIWTAEMGSDKIWETRLAISQRVSRHGAHT